ncbi:PEPxxWA-CTERM sorting domain-containing protein (plasmid) [Polymorphobacter sp. PAMC 29334]|uniref:PEPxxWA-CTERM sorting domain-containing protein n=1 Tax=Polymorphobacter sp. PAMC 29334 TaxID=2862331 RepID=UPI001C761B3D|nr:PEPxxWA-CTERM sorting domain-containing protein [Polymorphobacter sp. PAMC 29334]QYE33252.1 PEPxxWA-CTERM sorting domain-containing protein [Polymorphobacter sp. PAMC 29334]
MPKSFYAVAAVAAVAIANVASAGTTTIDFNNHTAPHFTGSYTIYDSSITNVAAAVNDTPFLAVPVDGARFGQAYYNSDKAITSISFDWGSPDSYNTMAFISPDHGNAFVNPMGYNSQVTGSNVTLVNGRATFNFLASDKVTKVAFASSERAFEIDNLSATAVPEPAAWTLMIVGFGMVGFAARHRSRFVAA